jgi:hypothetical protein
MIDKRLRTVGEAVEDGCVDGDGAHTELAMPFGDDGRPFGKPRIEPAERQRADDAVDLRVLETDGALERFDGILCLLSELRVGPNFGSGKPASISAC